MGWLSRIFKGSEHKVSEGHYYKEDADYYLPSTSGVSNSDKLKTAAFECFRSFASVLRNGDDYSSEKFWVEKLYNVFYGNLNAGCLD